MLERRLKRAPVCFPDREARADCALRGAKYFDVLATEFLEFRAHRAGGELGRIAVAAEMPEHDAGDFAGQQLRDDRGGGGVGKMTMPRLDPLLHRPGPVRILLQKFLVVIRLDDKGLHLPETLDR